MITATILVEPVAKGRPRFAMVNGHARSYTPKKTVNAETAIAWSVRQELGEVQPFPAGVPVRLQATFYRPRPQGTPRRVLLPVKKPDLDNYLKLLLDALNRFAFADDAQITTMTVRKRFAEPGTLPRIELTLEEDKIASAAGGGSYYEQPERKQAGSI